MDRNSIPRDIHSGTRLGVALGDFLNGKRDKEGQIALLHAALGAYSADQIAPETLSGLLHLVRSHIEGRAS